MGRDKGPRFLVAEESLVRTTLGRSLAERLPLSQIHQRISPADYPSFRADELVLTRHRGAFLKPCPGTRGYICCGLQIIHFGLGCYFDCTYCILQGYLNTPALVLFGNVDEGLEELQGVLDQNAPPHRRFCTGEFTDSLLLEDLTGFGTRLIKIFASHKHVTLELKTKTDNVKPLRGLDHGGRTVISFSVNAPNIAASEESRAATLKRRLAASALMVREGYRVGFHFDPLIRHPGWEEGYYKTVAEIFEAVPTEKIAWISLGAFRYLPRLKNIVRRRHPKSRIMDEEFVPAPDGKMRYPRPLRVEMYGRVLEAIREFSPQACVYMCMENPRVWQEVFGYNPGPEGLIRMLDQRV